MIAPSASEAINPRLLLGCTRIAGEWNVPLLNAAEARTLIGAW